MILRLAIIAATCCATSALPVSAEEGSDLEALRQLVASVDFSALGSTMPTYGKAWELRLLGIEDRVRQSAGGIAGTVTGSIPRSE